MEREGEFVAGQIHSCSPNDRVFLATEFAKLKERHHLGLWENSRVAGLYRISLRTIWEAGPTPFVYLLRFPGNQLHRLLLPDSHGRSGPQIRLRLYRD
jgi:hypothetical protein